MKHRLHLSLMLLAFCSIVWIFHYEALGPLIIVIPVILLNAFSSYGEQIGVLELASAIGFIAIILTLFALVKGGHKLLILSKCFLAVSAILFVAESTPFLHTAITTVLQEMDTGNIVPLCFAAPLAVCLVVREVRWRGRMSTWIRSEGVIVGFNQDPHDDGPSPILRYRYKGEYREQIVEFNLYAEPLGKEVPILIDPVSGEAFVLTLRDRWFLSLFLVCCILGLSFLSYASN